MEKQYSKQFFFSFVDALQKLCRSYLDFDEAVEVSGYLSLEIDNQQKERYVLSELLQTSGRVISESYCTKAFRTMRQMPQNDDILSLHQKQHPKCSNEWTNPFSQVSHTSSQPISNLDILVPVPKSTNQPLQQISPNIGPVPHSINKVTNSTKGVRLTNNSQINSPSCLREVQNYGQTGPRDVQSVGQSPRDNIYIGQSVRDTTSYGQCLKSSKPHTLSSATSKVSQKADHKSQTKLEQETVEIKSEVLDPVSCSTISTSQNIHSTNQVGSAPSAFIPPVTVNISSTIPRTTSSDDLYTEFQIVDMFTGQDKTVASSPKLSDMETGQQAQHGNVLTVDSDDDDADDEDITLDDGDSDDDIVEIEDPNQSPVPTNVFINDAAHGAEENSKTVRKTRCHMKLFTDFLEQRGEMRPIHMISAADLDPLIGTFLLNVKKDNGTEYEPSSLKGIHSSLDRHLRKQRYAYCITRDSEFRNSRKLLRMKQQQLKLQGKGNYPCRVAAITDDDIEVLYEKEQLGTRSPDVLLNTVWFMNNVNFGMKGLQDHYNLKWGDIQLGMDHEYGLEYLEYVGPKSAVKSPAPLKVFAQPMNPHRCYVAFYKAYRDVRPRASLEHDSPFYLTVNRYPSEGEPWFKQQSAGWNRLSSVMRRMVAGAGLGAEKKLTNISAYKHASGKFNQMMQFQYQPL